MTSLALCLLLAQVAAAPKPKPLMMPGFTNQEFQSQVASVVNEAKGGNWAEAKKKSLLLPSKKLAIQYDDKEVPAGSKEAFREGFDEALQLWRVALKDYDLSVAKSGQLRIAFAPELAVNEDSGIPRGAASFWSEDSKSPRLEVVIGLTRMKPAERATQIQVKQEVVYAIGQYFGLAEAVVPTKAMARTDLMSNLNPRIDRGEVSSVDRAVALSDSLRASVADGKVPLMAFPRALLGINFYKGEPIDEGKPYLFQIPVSNMGDGDLHLAVVPNCSCFTVESPDVIAPGDTKVINVKSSTQGYMGEQHKALFIYTDDPDDPVRMFRFDAFIRPKFRVIDPNGGKVIPVNDEGTRASLIVYAPSGKPFKVTSASLAGVQGEASVGPFSGELADPEMQQPATQREGYKIDVLMSAKTIQGRVPVTLVVNTDDPQYPRMNYRLVLQRGIVSDPEEVFFGHVKRRTSSRVFTLTSAGAGFKVLDIGVSDPCLKATWDMVSPEKYKVTVQLTDKVDFGQFVGELRIKTDSASQPTVFVPVRATVE
ncbi:MAG: DUF1573 domain-containing protein [Armatimonadota bacterium]